MGSTDSLRPQDMSFLPEDVRDMFLCTKCKEDPPCCISLCPCLDQPIEDQLRAAVRENSVINSERDIASVVSRDCKLCWKQTIAVIFSEEALADTDCRPTSQ